MQKKCAATGKKFLIRDKDKQFYKKMNVPAPTLCPVERDRRRQAWINHRSLHKKICAGTNKNIVSAYTSDNPIPIMATKYWWSDSWDQLATEKNFDFNRTFFEQWQELNLVAPRPALLNMPQYDQNSDYTNHSGKNKNCYLSFATDNCRDVMYSYLANSCTNVIDCFRVEHCELCYECVDSSHCYDCRFVQNCTNCNNSWFLKNCIGCQDCFGCVNLRNKQYYFMNQKCTKNEYEKKIGLLELHKSSSLKNMRVQFLYFSQQFPHRFMEGTQNENVLGNYLTNCKNAYYCFDSRKLWDCAYIIQGFDSAKDCMDCHEPGDNSELLYECSVVGINASNCRFCSICMDQVSNLDYCVWCWQSSDLFGCVGLRKAQYCIFNKQYDEAEYFVLKNKIIEHMKATGEWGEFFPAQYSPFPYNDSLAQDYYPLAESVALTQKLRWTKTIDLELEKPLISTGSLFQIPETIDEVDENILQQVLICKKTNRKYKIQSAELSFYKQMKIPLPTQHYNARHQARYRLRNKRNLYQRPCSKTGQLLWTTYEKNRAEPIVSAEVFRNLVD
jgi:hypothetical protein